MASKKASQIFFTILLLSIQGCTNTIERLSRVGEAPKLTNMEIPVDEAFEEDAELSLKQQAQLEHSRRTNSLWQPGSTTFFRDNHAWRIGDIVKINVAIKDNAKLNNNTQQTRNASEGLGLPSFFGLEKKLSTVISRNGSNTNLVSLNGDRSHQGQGQISRTEDIKTVIAATVIQILPNGNLVLQGRQEVRVNHEVREVTVAGIARPKDIGISNSISSDQIAEARISYGGRGIVSDVQQPRVGHQILDIVSPF